MVPRSDKTIKKIDVYSELGKLGSIELLFCDDFYYMFRLENAAGEYKGTTHVNRSAIQDYRVAFAEAMAYLVDDWFEDDE